MLFPALLLLAYGEKSFAPAMRPAMPRAHAAVAGDAAVVPRVPMQGAAPPVQPEPESRSSMLMMVSNVLICSGLSLLAGGAGLALRRSASAPATETELTQAFVDAELGTAPVSQQRERLGAVAAPAVFLVNAEAPKETLKFLTPAKVEEVRTQCGTPSFVYDAKMLVTQARTALAFPHAYGLTVRYAMKASPNAAILQLFNREGLHIDASSGYECHRAMAAGVPAENISLSTQEMPEFFPELVKAGVKINACSLQQLDSFGAAFPGAKVGVRFNPGLGSGGTGKTNVGGPSSSFGIWHELLPDVQAIVAKHGLSVERIHTHIGSGSDPAVWQRVSGLSLDLCRQFPDVSILNLGGGYKVGRMSYEGSTDLAVVGAPVTDAFQAFAKDTGRELHLEIEPGTFLLANSGALVSTVQDVVTTGDAGHSFLKLDAGMTEVLRPSLYGAQHPIVTVKRGGEVPEEVGDYVVVGHCCESGDLLSCGPDEPETIAERRLGACEAGDLLVVEGAGAYCAGMSTKNYNSFPEAAEVLLGADGSVNVIRRRQDYEQIWSNEVAVDVSGLA